MEFTRELMVMDEAMSDISTSEGDLSKSALCDETKISTVIKHLKDKILINKLQEDNNCSMQKVHFYLLLKCCWKVSDLLENDFDIGHFVERTLHPALFVRIVWELHLENYFYESVAQCPPVLSDGLLEAAGQWIFSNLKHENVRDVARKLSEATYLKMLRIEKNLDTIDGKHRSAISKKLHDHFVKLTDSVVVVKNDSNDSQATSVINLAKSLICILRLLRSCLDCFLGDGISFSPQLYKMELSYDYTSKWPFVSSEDTSVANCNLHLVQISVDLFENLSIDSWCSFSEYDSDSDGKSFQKVIGEEVFMCLPLLKRLNRSEQCDLLILMLNTMAIKPWDEDDDIKIATLEEVVKSVYDRSKSQRKWLHALLQFDVNVFSNETCLECLEKNLQLQEFQDVALLLQNVLHTLQDNSNQIDVDYNERLKRVTFSSIRQFPVEQQLQIMESFFKEFKINENLYTTNFTSIATEVFNKAVCNEGSEKDKFFAECITLCFQSPCKLLMRMLSECLSNAHLTTLMVESLAELRFVAVMNEFDEEGNISNNCLIANLLLELMDRPVWSEQELNNFPHMVKLLIDNSIVPEKVFLEDCLFPAISRSLETNEWNVLFIWLQTLSEVKVKDSNLNMGSLLIILARVLESSRCDTKSFTVEAAAVGELSIEMIDHIIQDILAENLDGKFKKWLTHKLAQPDMSPLNKSYFGKLLRSVEIGTSRNNEWDCILFDALQNGKVSSDMLEILKNNTQDKEDFRLHLWASLLKVFSILTATEWKNLSCIKELFPDLDKAGKIMFLFDILTESLLFWFLYADIELSGDECVLSCLKFSVQNFGSTLQHVLLPNIHHLSPNEIKTVFEKTIFMVEKSPVQIKELWALLLVPILTKIMCAAMGSVLRPGKLGSDVKVYFKEMCCAISVSSNPEVRLALARQLAELTH